MKTQKTCVFSAAWEAKIPKDTLGFLYFLIWVVTKALKYQKHTVLFFGFFAAQEAENPKKLCFFAFYRFGDYPNQEIPKNTKNTKRKLGKTRENQKK